MPLIVSYDLASEGKKDYAGLIEELESRNSAHILKSTWLVETEESPEVLLRKIRKHLDPDDKVLINSVPVGAKWTSQMPDADVIAAAGILGGGISTELLLRVLKRVERMLKDDE